MGPGAPTTVPFTFVYDVPVEVVCDVAPKVRGEYVEIKDEDHRDDEREDGHEFADHDDGVERARLLHAAVDEQHDRPVQERDENHAQNGEVARERRIEISDGGDEHDAERHVADPNREPVTPSGDESDERSKSRMGVSHDAVEFGFDDGEASKGGGEAHEADSGDEPGNERGSRSRGGRDISGECEHARADCRADDERDEPHQADAMLVRRVLNGGIWS